MINFFLHITALLVFTGIFWQQSSAQIQIGVAKQAGVVNFTGNNTFEIPYILTLKNLGTVPATNVQVTENLLTTFPLPVSVLSVSNLSATSPLTLNQAFDGKTNMQLLTGTNTLPVGISTYLIRFTVRVNLNSSATVTFNNSVTATTAVLPGGVATSTDVSANGTDPDPNNNKNPGDAGESDLTPVSLGQTTSFFCKGISGSNLIVGGDFGSGVPNVGSALAPGVTTYPYTSTDLGVDGTYSIVQNVQPLKSDWTITSDHTGNPGGYYMAVNADFQPKIFFTQTVSNLCLNTTYEFSIWVRNQHFVFKKPNLPLIEFLLNGSTAFTAQPIPENNQWVKQGFIFNSGNSSTVTISIRNAGPGGSGNDLGLDDVSLISCLPNPIINTATLPVCVGNDAIITARIPDYNTNYSNWDDSQWERSTDGGNTWTVVAGPFAGTPPFTFNAGPTTLAMNGHRYRLKVATTLSNLTSNGCFTVSASTTLQVGAEVNFTTTLTNPTCALTDGRIVVNSIAATDSVSIDGGVFARANATTLTFNNLNTGTHTISVKRFPCQKDELIILKSPTNCGPVIGIAKRVSPAVSLPDGTFNATYSFVIKNYGTVPLTNVQVTDNLNATVTNPATYSLVAASMIATGTLTANAGFNGNTNTTLLDASNSTLPVGASQTITFTVNIRPNSFFGPYNNTATASANGSTGGNTSAISTNGNDSDPNNNGIPNEAAERIPTPLRIDPRPVIGVAKAVSFPVLQSDDSYDIDYTLTVKNYGNVDLSAIQITDNLTATFPSPVTYTLKSAPVATGRLVANTAFNGSSDRNLLVAGSSVLLLGETQEVTFTINVKLNAGSGRYTNTATASGTGPGASGTSTDVSTDGTDPDPNRNGNPSDTGEDKTTGVDLPAKPAIGVAKSASAPALQPNGSYNITFSITLSNLCSEDLTNIKLTDNLSTTFPSPATFTIVNLPTATGNLTTQTTFNGSTVTSLLAGNGGTLPVGTSAVVTFTINVVPNSSFGPFSNNALASGQGLKSNVIAKDISNAGTDPDPNNNGNSSDGGEEDKPTVVSLTPNPVIGVAKSASAPALQGNGSYNITYTLTVRNLGNVVLNNVQVTDNLRATFPNPVSYTLSGPPITSLTPNAGFNGSTNQNLLGANSTLAIGASATIIFGVNVVPNGLFGPFSNTAIGSGTSPNNILTSDLSNNGNDPDPDNDGNPSNGGNDDQPTVVRLTPKPVIGISESAGTPVLQPDGSYDIIFTLVLENLGNVNLDNVQVSNNLPATFPAPAIYKVVSSPFGTGLTGNAAFEGASSPNLLSGNNTLNVGEKKTLTFKVNVLPNGVFGLFENSSIATATGVGGTDRTTDISNDGVSTDPNGNGNPTESGENTPTPVKLLPVPRIGIAKSASTPVLQANGSYNVTFIMRLQNYGNVNLTAVQITDNLSATFPSPATFSIVPNTLSVTGTLLVNSNFNGNTDTQLLISTGSNPGTLAIGTSETLTFIVNVIANGNFGPFRNTALASAEGADNKGSTSDISTNSTNPDPDGNGNPDEPDNNEPTIVSFASNPVIGLAKSVGIPTIQPDGSYNVTYTFSAKNYGNVTLNNVQIMDDLTTVFVSPVTFTFVGNTSGTGFTTNANFNGNSDKNLLAANNTLSVGETKTVTLTLNIKAGTIIGPFTNSATASGISAADSKTTNDVSTDGINPDPNNDVLPSENTLTSLTFLTPTPVIGVAKAVSRAVIQQDGSYNVTYSLKIKNLGNVTLNNVQVTDNLAATFPAPTTFSIVPGSLSATRGLAVNTGFTGTGTNTNLLAANQNLTLADSSVITFTVKIVVTTSFGPFANSATASGTGVGGTGNTSDISNTGTNPDPNANGKPNDAGEDSQTSFTITPTPVIGVAKSVGSPVPQPNTGSNNVIYTITIVNLGNVVLNNVQVTDDLSKTFPVASNATFSIVAGSISATGGLTPNLTFDGKTQTNLLNANNTLPIGATATVTFTVNIVGGGTFSNSVTGTAVGVGNSGNTTDISNTGTNPDPNNDGNPSEPNENSPTNITLAPSELVIPEGFSPNGDGTNDTFFIKGQGNAGVNMEVYNRWGNVVYKNENYKNDWNGTCNRGIYFGQNLPDGTYYYIIKLSNGKQYVSFLTINR